MTQHKSPPDLSKYIFNAQVQAKVANERAPHNQKLMEFTGTFIQEVTAKMIAGNLEVNSQEFKELIQQTDQEFRKGITKNKFIQTYPGAKKNKVIRERIFGLFLEMVEKVF